MIPTMNNLYLCINSVVILTDWSFRSSKPVPYEVRTEYFYTKWTYFSLKRVGVTVENAPKLLHYGPVHITFQFTPSYPKCFLYIRFSD